MGCLIRDIKYNFLKGLGHAFLRSLIITSFGMNLNNKTQSILCALT